jgi:type II secretory pathway component GspD/PulD (secretin)
MRCTRLVPLAVLALLGARPLPLAAQTVSAPAPAVSAGDDLRTSKEAIAPQEATAGVTPVVSIRRTDAPLTEVLRELQDQTGINFVATPEVTSDVRVKDVNLEKLPWRDALRALLLQTEAIIEEETPRMVRIGRPPRVTMEFRNAPIASVVDMIGKVSGANIIISSQVQGNITVRLTNIPWNAALDSIVKTAGFTTVREEDKIIRIVDPKQLQAQLETKYVQLKFLRPPPKYTGTIKTPYAREAGGAAGGAAAPAAPAPAIGGSPDLAGFTVLNIVRNMLSKDATGKDVGKLDYDRDTSTLIVTDTKPILDKVTELIKLIDVEPLQVLIDVNFVSTQNTDLMTLGTNFALGTDEGLTFSTQALPPATVPGLGSNDATRVVRPFNSPDIDAPPAGGGAGKVTSLPFGLGAERPVSEQLFLTKYDFLSTFRVFKKDKFSKIIQRPTLAAINNQEATIFLGEEIHYAETKAVATQSGGTSFEISEAQKSPVKVGFQLLIIPNIIPESEKVILTVIPQNETLSGDPSTAAGKVSGFERFIIAGLGVGGTTLTIDLPRIRSATVVTRMLLESGQTTVIGGLVQDNVGKTVTKIPLLGDIPILGWLFKQESTTEVKDHLFIFITPRIIRSSRDTRTSIDEQLQGRTEVENRALKALKKGDRAAGEALDKQFEERRRREEEEFRRLEREAEDTGAAPKAETPATDEK